MISYLDASVVVPLIVAQPQTPMARKLAGSIGTSGAISSFVRGEISSAIARLVRMDECDEADGRLALTRLDAWCGHDVRMLESNDGDIRIAETFVRRFDLGLRLPDAIHLALVHRCDAELITFDTRLGNAARLIGIRTRSVS